MKYEFGFIQEDGRSLWADAQSNLGQEDALRGYLNRDDIWSRGADRVGKIVLAKPVSSEGTIGHYMHQIKAYRVVETRAETCSECGQVKTIRTRYDIEPVSLAGLYS